MKNVFGAEFRRIDHREHRGKPALVAVAMRSYDTSVEDLWEALTTPERLARWFLPVEGDLRVGGRYQLKGNAGGTIERCSPPEVLEVTWEFGGGMSWVHVRLAAEGPRARLTLEHIAHQDGAGAEHMDTYGPGAVGVGWDLALHGLAQHLATGGAPVDPAAFEAWSLSEEGKAFARASAEAWGAAHTASGQDAAKTAAQVARTMAFYTGA